MELDKAYAAIEAVLFASGEPIEIARIAQAVGVEKDIVYNILQNMKDKYDSASSGIELITVNDKYGFTTKAEFAPYIKEALEIKRNVPLSNAAMEVLAVIAYNQPVTKSFIEQVRGVDSSSTVNSLAEKGLVEEAGRLELPGRPIAYKTTDVFLRTFGLKSLNNLPPVPDDSGQISMDELVNQQQ